MTDYAILADVARLLNDRADPAVVLQAVVNAVRDGLPAAAVAVWTRLPGAATVTATVAPRAALPLDVAPALTLLPPSGGPRVPIVHGAILLGVLQIDGPGAAPAQIGALADVMAPCLAAWRLAEQAGETLAVRADEIEHERRFTELVVDSLPVGLYVVDRGYRIRMWNRKRETGTQGLRRSDVVGRAVFDVLSRQPADQLRAEFDAVFATGEIRETDLEVTDPDGARYYRISKIPMRLDGDGVSHVITIGEDVTGRRRLQQRAMQTEKLAAIGQLAAGVMHEINNPLATIGACVAACEMRLDDRPADAAAPLREYLKIIDKEVLRCTRIVDGLLDFSRPQGSAKRAADLDAILDDTLFLLKHHQRFRTVSVVREVQPGLPRIRANTEQLVQVFMALMLNALDAMDAGGRLTVRARRGVRPDEVQVEIEDTGVGIPEAVQPKIFEPFYTTKDAGRGTGLGLSICYGIVQEHHGRLEVESQPGRGSTFRVVLPMHPEDA